MDRREDPIGLEEELHVLTVIGVNREHAREVEVAEEVVALQFDRISVSAVDHVAARDRLVRKPRRGRRMAKGCKGGDNGYRSVRDRLVEALGA